MGEESEKEWMCIYVQLNHFVAHRNYHNIVNQLYVNKTLKNEKKSMGIVKILQQFNPCNWSLAAEEE